MSSRVYSLQSFICRINYILRKYFYERKMDPKRRCQEDEDCLFLEHVLDKLYDFGHGLESKKKLKSQKKKKRKRCDEEEEKKEEEEEEESSVAENSSKDKSKQLKTEQAGPSSQNQVEVIVFQDPRKKQNMKEPPAPPALSTPQEPEKTQSDQTEELNLEKARLEVHRFGITGFRKEQQRVFEQDRAIMLGARPPKRECVNYKILQQQIKEKKQKAKEDVQPDVKKKKKRRNEKDKKTASSGLGAAPTGQMGRFKNGMLILSSSEIQKIKGRK